MQSNKLEDQVFWYKASEHDDFKLGAQEYWDYAEQNGGGNREEQQYGGYKNQYVVDKNINYRTSLTC